MEKFELVRHDELFVLSFPESDRWACDGVWLYEEDLQALRQAIDNVLSRKKE